MCHAERQRNREREPSASFPGNSPHRTVERVELLDESLDPLEIAPADLGRRQGACRAVQKLDAELRLQPADELGGLPRTRPKARRGAGETARLHDGDEHPLTVQPVHQANLAPFEAMARLPGRKGVDQLAAETEKRQKEDGEREAAIKAAETAVDFHTVENRNKRKVMQERRHTLAREIGLISENLKLGQQSLQGLYQSNESNLELAKPAEGWSWKEAPAETEAS